MAFRFHLATKIGTSQGFSGGELKLKRSRIGGLLWGVNLTICPNFRRSANNSVRRLICNSSSLHEDNSSATNSFRPKSYYDVLVEEMRERGEDTLPAYIHAGPWECAVQMPEVVEAADLAVKLYNNKQNAKLELVGLVKANGILNAGWYFNIILEAVDHDTGEKNEYEAYVQLHAVMKSESKLLYLRLASDKSKMHL